MRNGFHLTNARKIKLYNHHFDWLNRKKNLIGHIGTKIQL